MYGCIRKRIIHCDKEPLRILTSRHISHNILKVQTCLPPNRRGESEVDLKREIFHVHLSTQVQRRGLGKTLQSERSFRRRPPKTAPEIVQSHAQSGPQDSNRVHIAGVLCKGKLVGSSGSHGGKGCQALGKTRECIRVMFMMVQCTLSSHPGSSLHPM